MLRLVSVSTTHSLPEVVEAYTAGNASTVADPSADVWSVGVRFKSENRSSLMCRVACLPIDVATFPFVHSTRSHSREK
jgi:hypothetical protein